MGAWIESIHYPSRFSGHMDWLATCSNGMADTTKSSLSLSECDDSDCAGHMLSINGANHSDVVNPRAEVTTNRYLAWLYKWVLYILVVCLRRRFSDL
ncbi:hypothetical protein WVI01_04190 [Weissella viridescens]|nr:hypothetical protein WVI01_04190 [Weissella viridescens]